MTVIRLTWEGLDEAAAELSAMGGRVRDARPAWALVDQEVTRFLMEQFDTEGRAGGRPWPPLAPSTLKARAQAGRGRGGILRDTNRMWASLVKVGPESVRVMEPERYERGTTVAYAQAHQEGRGVPVRQIWPDPLPSGMAERFENILLQYFMGEGTPVTAAGGRKATRPAAAGGGARRDARGRFIKRGG